MLKLSAYEMLNWILKDLAPATRYEYRIQLKRAAEESMRLAAAGSFRTQRKGPATYTALLLTDPHTGTFAEGSEPLRTLDKVVQNAARTEADFVLNLGDNVAWRGSREFPQRDANGAVKSIGAPRSGNTNTALHKVGASYKVVKLLSDPPHWSDNGH